MRQKISGRLRSETTTSLRYAILGYASKKAGNPYCTLDVQGTSGHYNRADAFQLSSTLQPGQSTRWQDPNVTVTSQGASYVTQGTITCQ